MLEVPLNLLTSPFISFLELLREHDLHDVTQSCTQTTSSLKRRKGTKKAARAFTQSYSGGLEHPVVLQCSFAAQEGDNV